MASPARFCRACGKPTRPGARFCMGCGASLNRDDRGTPAPSVRGRASRARVPLATGALVLVAVAGIAGLMILRDSGAPASRTSTLPPTESAVTTLEPDAPAFDEKGRPYRGHVRLDHPSGATADVPGGPVLFGDVVDLKKLALPDDSPAWDRGDSAWKFVANSGLVLTETVTLDLPASGAGDDSVIALTSSGAWVDLPSEAITLAGGQPGLRVTVREVPAPWTLAVARPRPGAAGPPESSESERLERLYWTDRSAWEQDVRTWLPKAEFVISESATSYVSSRAGTAARTWFDVARDLRAAEVTLGAARLWAGSAAAASGVTFATPLPGGEVTGYQLYVSGIDQLARVRDDWVGGRQRYLADGLSLSELIVTSDGQNLEQAIESALYAYAPWGVHFTRWLTRTGTAEAMDLRVLRPYGQLYYTDIPLKTTAQTLNKTMESDITAASAPFVPSSVHVTRYLRLYSTWAIEDTSWLDTFRAWKGDVDFFLRYWSVAASAAGWLVGTVTGTGVLVAAGIAATDQFVDYLGSQYQESEDGTAWATFEALGDEAVWSGAVPLALAWAENRSSALHLLLSNEEDMVFQPGVKDLVSYLIDIGLTAAALNSNWYMLKDVRAITSDTRGYCPRSECGYLTARNIPPVQAIAVLRGDAAGRPAGAYPIRGSRVVPWNVEFISPYHSDLHAMLVGEKFINTEGWQPGSGAIGNVTTYPPKGKWPGGFKDLKVTPYRPDSGIDRLSFAARTDPHMQVVRVAIPKDVLNTIAIDYELGPNPKFADFGLVLRLESPDGHRNTFSLEEEGERKTSDKANMVYASVQLTREGFEPGDDVDQALADWYNGLRQAADGGVLFPKLSGTLKAHSDQEPRLSFELDFAKKPARTIYVDKDDLTAPRLHVTDAEAKAPGNVFRLSSFKVYPADMRTTSAVDAWKAGKLGPERIVACADNPSSCYVMFYTPPGAPPGTIEAVITGSDKKPANGMVVATQVNADSPTGDRWLQFQNNAFFGTFRVDIATYRNFDGSIIGDRVTGKIVVVTVVDSEETGALFVDGFPVGGVGLSFEGTRVK